MRWTQSPDWSGPTSRLLHDTLGKAFYKTDDLIVIWQHIGMNPALVDWNGPATIVWRTLTREAANCGRLVLLIEHVRSRRQALAAEFDAVLAAELPAQSWYACPDPFESRMIGPGRKLAVLDRYRLRAAIVNLAKHDYPVLSISGAAGTGRSYSRRVLQHVAHQPTVAADLIVVDAAVDLSNPAHAPHLLWTLAVKLGFTADLDADRLTEITRQARELVTLFVGGFRQIPPACRWIFLDSLDRSHVQPDLHAAVGHLAREIEAGQLGNTRLIVTGHPGDFPSDVLEVLQEETIPEIAEPEVRSFFADVASDVGRPVTGAELDDLVKQVITDAASLTALGRSASSVACAFFGTAP